MCRLEGFVTFPLQEGRCEIKLQLTTVTIVRCYSAGNWYAFIPKHVLWTTVHLSPLDEVIYNPIINALLMDIAMFFHCVPKWKGTLIIPNLLITELNCGQDVMPGWELMLKFATCINVSFTDLVQARISRLLLRQPSPLADNGWWVDMSARGPSGEAAVDGSVGDGTPPVSYLTILSRSSFIWRLAFCITAFDKALAPADRSHHAPAPPIEKLICGVICQPILRLCQTVTHARCL